VTSDGIFGSQTSLAVMALKSDAKAIELTIRKFYTVRRDYYTSLRNFQYFGTDWLRRDLDIEQEALAMVGCSCPTR
jgi:lysozyme family protein